MTQVQQPSSFRERLGSFIDERLSPLGPKLRRQLILDRNSYDPAYSEGSDPAPITPEQDKPQKPSTQGVA